MADVTLTYQGATIAELSDSGSKTIRTAGKFCEADIGVEYVKPSGGSGVLTGSFTPASNAVTAEITVDRAISGLAIKAASNPYGGGVRVVSALLFTANTEAPVSAVSSNASGSASAGSWNASVITVSQNGNTVTVHSPNAANAGYFLAGITYDWVAW